MSCGRGPSNFERKKRALLNVNMWKSNFISLWRKYGTFKTVDGVECFDFYNIDGNGEGQIKMSKLLKQPTLYLDVQDDNLDWVHLVFNLGKLVEMIPDNILAWLDNYKATLAEYSFEKLHYEIVNNVVTSAYFLSADALVPVTPATDPVTYEPTTYTQIDDIFLNHLALTIAERRNMDVSAVTYDAVVSLGDVENLMNSMAAYTLELQTADPLFDLPMIEIEISAWLMERSIGTDILDQLVMEGTLLGISDIATGMVTYAFPVQTAKKMNGFSFLNLVELGLDFTYKVDSHWYDFFLKIIKLIIASVLVYFQFYTLALSLVISFAADVTDSKILKVLSTIVSIYSLDITSLSTVGASEALQLVMNVYSLYVELSFKPEAEIEEDVVDNDQQMFYKAPYSAYSDLYCYKALTSVSVTSVL